MMLTKKYGILIGTLILAVFLGGTLAYFGWSSQKSGLANQPEQPEQEPEPVSSQPEQLESEPMKKVMIPSSLSSEEVVVDFARYTHLFGDVITQKSDYWSGYFGINSPNEGFVGGTGTMWYGASYFTKGGTEIKEEDASLGFILVFMVLKYKTPDFSQEDYKRISYTNEFRELTLKNIKLKTKLGLPSLEKIPTVELKAMQYQQYLLHSNNFIIYSVGLKEAAEDIMIRVIDQYTVE